MENKKANHVLYMVDKETGEEIEIGKITGLSYNTEDNEEIYFSGNLAESINVECIYKPKIITKKRFIKLLMSKGFQRNIAKELHQEYMKLCIPRTKIGISLLITALTRELDQEFEVQQKND